MSVAIDAYASIWRPKDRRSRCEWAEQHVKPPGSARSSSFSRMAAPWLAEPIDWSANNQVREQVLLMPTGAGKTTVFDCVIPHSISEDPGGILLALQTDPDAKEYVEERLMPILRSASPVEHILAGMNRHSIRKDAIIFPHLPLYMNGAKLTAFQRRSVRYCLGDEVWRWKHGYVDEFRARHHDRWNARVILVSQGGSASILRDSGMVETELEHAWQRTDRREWCFECPQCREVQRFRMKALGYETGEDRHGILDENAVMQSARYRCAGAIRENPTCDAVFEDKIGIRRQLANSGRYVPQNLAHLARHHGWHCNALTLFYLPWGQLAVEHAKGMRALKTGDDAPIRVFRQKRLAENYITEVKAVETALTVGDYTLQDYAAGQLWPGEAVRIMTVDVQRDHFWVVIRAWKADGSSRRIYVDKVSTEDGLRHLQETLRVKDECVYVDPAFDEDMVYNMCGKYGWNPLRGDGNRTMFRFTPRKGRPYFKFFSPVRSVAGTSQIPVGLLFWAVLPIKRILEKMRGGYRAPWEVERDMDPKIKKQLFSEIEKDVISKTTKMVTRQFVKVVKDNHVWDCEGMQVPAAMIAGVLADQPDASISSSKEAGETPVSIDTTEEADVRS